MRKTQQEGSTLYSYFNKSVELGSSVVTTTVVTTELIFLQNDTGNFEIVPFLEYVMDCSPTSYTLFASPLLLTLTGTKF
jgi:hypothetical protein